LSIGGMIGLWLAAHSGDRLTGLVLANTSPRMADPTLFEARRRTVLEQGIGAVADAVIERFFSERMRSAKDPAVSSVRNVLLATNPVGYASCCAAVRDMNQVELMAACACRHW